MEGHDGRPRWKATMKLRSRSLERKGCIQVLRKLWKSLKGSESSKTVLIGGRLPVIPSVLLFGLEGKVRYYGDSFLVSPMVISCDHCLLVIV
jgi:hypothetical protein